MQSLLNLPYVNEVRALALAQHIPIILVGGAVRDALLGKPVHDLDFAVQHHAVVLARATANALGGDFYLMDAERGTARVILTPPDAAPFYLDFAQYRGEASGEGGDWNADLLARDLSINAIAYDLLNDVLLDPAGGQADLAARVIRQASPHTLDDDPVRALRAVRMAVSLGYAIEPDTAQSIQRQRTRLDIPSPERVRDELVKALTLPNAAQAVRQFDAYGLLTAMIPEMEPLRDCTQSPPHVFTALEHTFVVLDYLDQIITHVFALPDAGDVPAWLTGLQIAPGDAQRLAQQLRAVTSNDRTRGAAFRLAALLHDIAKPSHRSVDDHGRIHFYEHEEAGAPIAAARAHALKFSSDEVQQIRVTVQQHMRPNQMARDQSEMGPSPRAIYRYMRDVGVCAPEISLFCLADGMGKAGAASALDDAQRRARIASLLIVRYYEHYDPRSAPAPLLNGNDILALGVRAGPRIGDILNRVREAQMVGEVTTVEAALELARRLAAERVDN
jgi:tRNA nucleotidyltransferase/poly(A) polymerase